MGDFAESAPSRVSHPLEARQIAAQPVVDLGRVPFDSQVEAHFVLENTGGQPVRVVGAPTVKTLEGC